MEDVTWTLRTLLQMKSMLQSCSTVKVSGSIIVQYFPEVKSVSTVYSHFMPIDEEHKCYVMRLQMQKTMYPVLCIIPNIQSDCLSAQQEHSHNFVNFYKVSFNLIHECMLCRQSSRCKQFQKQTLL